MPRTVTLEAPVVEVRTLPVIDPQSLTRDQRDGRRCAVPNCQRRLADMVYQAGRLPCGQPVLVCEDCAPVVSYAVSKGCRPGT
jgi:hypothetical protein